MTERTTVSIDRESHARLLAIAEQRGWNVGQAVEYALFHLSDLTEEEAKCLEFSAEVEKLQARLSA